MNTSTEIIISLTIMFIVATIAFTIIYLASLGFDSKISINKEKIEVTSTNSNLNQ